MKRTCFLLIVVALAGCVSARDVGVPSVAENEGDRPSTVRFCTLLAHPEQFDGRRVRVHAVYRSGFEWSELYCVACRGSRQMWLEFAESYEPPRTRPDRRALHGGKSVVGRTVDVVAIGTFHSAGHYGHKGAFDFLFVVDRVESARILFNDSKVPEALSKDERDRLPPCD
jgi:hypothetical protein